MSWFSTTRATLACSAGTSRRKGHEKQRVPELLVLRLARPPSGQLDAQGKAQEPPDQYDDGQHAPTAGTAPGRRLLFLLPDKPDHGTNQRVQRDAGTVSSGDGISNRLDNTATGDPAICSVDGPGFPCGIGHAVPGIEGYRTMNRETSACSAR